MPGLWQFGEVPFDIADGKIARNNLNGSFGTNYDVPSIQVLRVEVQTRSGQLSGDGGITSVASRIISCQVTMRLGGMPMEVLSAITGQTIQSSGTGTNAYRHLRIAVNRKMPYFAIAGKATSEEDDGEAVLFAPKLKVIQSFSLGFEDSNFVIPELTCFGVGDANFLDAEGEKCVFLPITYASAHALTIPPHGFA